MTPPRRPRDAPVRTGWVCRGCGLPVTRAQLVYEHWRCVCGSGAAILASEPDAPRTPIAERQLLAVDALAALLAEAS